MRAFVATRFGGPEVMGLASLPEPEAGPGEVVVEVRASSVNPVDWMMRGGFFGPGSVARFPRALGVDFAGTIHAVGKGVSTLRPGAAVYGIASPLPGGQGAHAERLAVPASCVHPIPRGLGFEEAAVLPTAALTVLDAFWRSGSVLGKRVLVTGACSGIGPLALQIASARGARVTAVCGVAHHDRARALGAAEVVDEDAGELAGRVPPHDLLFDGRGGLSPAGARPLLARGGILATAAPLRDPWPVALLRRLSGGPRVVVAVPRGRKEDYDVLARLLAAGRVRPVLADVFPLERAREAFAEQESGRSVGKVVIRVGEGRAAAGRPAAP
jgi:NADPH:quinone reductase-like Zn-dependent oxidoreductase